MPKDTTIVRGTNLIFNRSIIFNSNSAYQLTLPKIWIDSLNLKPKQKLVVIMDTNGNLLIENPNLIKERKDE